nr:nardilysin-like [Quercus suber]
MLQTDAIADHVFGKKIVNLPNRRKRREEALIVWKKRSIFFTLPYLEYYVLHHNLDVVHIKKNVFDYIIGTLLNLDGKTNDNLKARQDLKDMVIRSELHLEKVGNDQTSLQVFYVEDVRHKDWAVVVKIKPREVFDVGINASHDNDDDDDDDDDEVDFIDDEELNDDVYEFNDEKSNDDDSNNDESSDDECS